MKFQKQHGKKIGIFGLGITGSSVYRNLLPVAKEIIVYDNLEASRRLFAEKFGPRHLHPLQNNKWSELDIIITSPGISRAHSVFQLAAQYGIKISSDIELFMTENPDAEYVFITGTNGKSTVTALAGHILSTAGFDYVVGGNIGLPVMDLPFEKKGYIFELSSFQIELLNLDKVCSKISVITNITPDHLDRYKSIEEYADIKARILSPHALNFIGINSDISRQIYNDLKAKFGDKLIPVSTRIPLQRGIFCQKNKLEDGIFANSQESHDLPSLRSLQGEHNLENIGMAYGICRAISVPASRIIMALESFTGLAHRNQYVGTMPSKEGNICFYNDSKATNISSSLASLSSFENIIWFAGGRFKEKSLDPLLPIIKNIRKAYFFGESRELFAKFMDHVSVEYEIHDTLTEAFTNALEYSRKNANGKGLIFLLAPACSSYDQFRNFEERGNLFIKLVKDNVW